MPGTEINVGHHPGSLLRLGIRRKPREFGEVRLSPEHAEFAARMAVETFTEMTNNGQSFQSALVAVYLTGLDHGVNGSRDDETQT